MRKKRLFGGFLIGLLILMAPCVNSIEYQNQKNMIVFERETMDYLSFVNILKQILKDERRGVGNDVIKDVDPKGVICLILMYLWFWFHVLADFLPVMFISDMFWRFAEKAGCWFTIPPISGFSIDSINQCVRCALEQ